jgi:hypothetical protein
MWSLLQVIKKSREVRLGADEIRVERFGSSFADAPGIATICNRLASHVTNAA